jgi:hypothetical protein
MAVTQTAHPVVKGSVHLGLYLVHVFHCELENDDTEDANESEQLTAVRAAKCYVDIHCNNIHLSNHIVLLFKSCIYIYNTAHSLILTERCTAHYGCYLL